MSDLEQNKRTVLEFFELAFNQKRLEEAVERYVNPSYTQHNPQVADGPEGLLAFGRLMIAQFPNMKLEFKRVIAEGDLVSLHVHGKPSPDDRGIVSMDIFRLEDGKLIEHWDVSQEVPESAANDNGMF